MTSPFTRLAIGCFLAVASTSGVAFAQATTGTIEGQVKDAQGAVLPGVVMTATNTQTRASSGAASTGSGLYRIPYLPLGSYEVRAELSGFQTQVKTGVVVRLNETAVVDFTLSIAPLQQEVTVVAETPVIQTTKSELRRTYDEKALDDRPLGAGSRNVFSFATLAPGVATPGPRFGRALLGSGGSNVIANGTTARSSNFDLDGISNIDPEDNDYRVPVTVEGIKEFEVLTANYNAEFGRAGGAQMRAVTKSGTNAFHGSAYEFYYNNAKFQNRGSILQSATFADFTFHLYGGTSGGPLVRDKLFYFGLFENFRRRGETNSTASVFLPTERTARTGTDAGDRIVADWLALYPLPNRPEVDPRRYETVTHFFEDAPNPLVRLDANLTASTRLMGRYDVKDIDRDITAALPSNAGPQIDTAHTGGSNLTHIFSPSMVGEFRFGYAYREVGLPMEKGYEQFPTITISGGPSLVGTSNQRPIFRKLYDWQAIGSVSYTTGRHSLKTGYDVHRTFNNGVQSDFVRGLIDFGAGYGRTGIENFLAGTPTTYTVTIGNPYRNFRNWDVGLFVQDDYRLRDNVTLNVGLRNETVTPWTEKDDLTDYGYDTDAVNLAPRAGVAWDVARDGRWVVRGAYGLSYDRVNFFHLRSLAFQPPGLRTLTIRPTSQDQPLRVENLGPTSGSIAAGVPAKSDVDPDFGLGTVHTWNATLERDIARHTSVRVSYVGSAFRGIAATLRLNRAVPTPDATFFNIQARRPDPSLSNHSRIANASDGYYKGLQVSVERRYARGLQYQFSWTWSEALDMASDPGFGSADQWFSQTWDADLTFSRDGNNGPRKDDLWGPSRFDMRHMVTLNFSYETPWRRRAGVAGVLLSDWMLSGTAAYRDGVPLSVLCSVNAGDCNVDGGGQDRPNILDKSVLGFRFDKKPEVPADTSLVHVPPTAFDQTVAPGGRGTLSRNAFRSDDFLNIDMAVVRNIYLVGVQRVQLRFEVYNLTNNTQAGFPILSLADTRFGRITSVSGNRSMQIAAKYIW